MRNPRRSTVADDEGASSFRFDEECIMDGSFVAVCDLMHERPHCTCIVSCIAEDVLTGVEI